MNEILTSPQYLEYLEGFITVNRKAKFDMILQNRTNHFTVAVEDLFQLHNTSAVMRSCDVFGIQELHVIEQKFGKTIDGEIALGAQKWVDIHRYNSEQSCVDTLRSKGYQIIATTPHDESCFLEDFDISKPSALFFGTERLGLSEEIMKQADGFLKIPMVGFTESLNISVSAAIIIQNITQRLRASNIHWNLTEEEKFLRKLKWTKNSIKHYKQIEQNYLEKVM